MKAEHLSRKKTLNKYQEKPSGEITVYDLTGFTEGDYGTVRMADMSSCGDGFSTEDIERLPYGFETIQDIFSWCGALLSHSPMGGQLWRAAVKNEWSVGLKNMHNGGFHIDVPARKIFLDHFAMTPSSIGRSSYFRNALLIDFISALRDIWHEQRLKPFEMHYGPEDVLMLERVRAADDDIAAILTAWELRGAGFADVWRHIIGSPEGDMAMVFTRCLERDPSALFDGAALAYAFRQWYADESRVDSCDHDTLECLDDIVLESKAGNPFGSQIIEGGVVEAIACLPDGLCYLAGFGDEIIKDPFFAGLSDPINQAHLFHIVYDTEVTMVNDVPFRNSDLARKIFPSGD